MDYKEFRKAEKICSIQEVILDVIKDEPKMYSDILGSFYDRFYETHRSHVTPLMSGGDSFRELLSSELEHLIVNGVIEERKGREVKTYKDFADKEVSYVEVYYGLTEGWEYKWDPKRGKKT